MVSFPPNCMVLPHGAIPGTPGAPYFDGSDVSKFLPKIISILNQITSKIGPQELNYLLDCCSPRAQYWISECPAYYDGDMQGVMYWMMEEFRDMDEGQFDPEYPYDVRDLMDWIRYLGITFLIPTEPLMPSTPDLDYDLPDYDYDLPALLNKPMTSTPETNFELSPQLSEYYSRTEQVFFDGALVEYESENEDEDIRDQDFDLVEMSSPAEIIVEPVEAVAEPIEVAETTAEPIEVAETIADPAEPIVEAAIGLARAAVKLAETVVKLMRAVMGTAAEECEVWSYRGRDYQIVHDNQFMGYGIQPASRPFDPGGSQRGR